MNVKLLRKVKKHILAKPKRLQMQGWVRKKSIVTPLVEDVNGVKRPFADCGMAACIGGWTCILTHKEPAYLGDHFRVARKILDLTTAQAMRLFAPQSWPTKFLEGTKDDGKKKTAEVAAARIEHFIKTNGRE